MKSTRVSYFGYDGCLALENDSGTRVVLCPQAGGRVLEYALNGANAIYLDPAQRVWRFVPGAPTVDPCGGRMDVGPEFVLPPHLDLWLGDWHGEITGEGRARLTSARDQVTGLRLVREFTLSPNSSRLTCEQRITNLSEAPLHCCHWSRTLAVGGGIVLIPLSPVSRFPNRYVMYGPGSVINFRPEDIKIRVREGFLEILGAPARPKLGMDSAAGWLGYLTRNNLLFVKRFPVYPDRAYSEVAGLTLSILYYQNTMCELEPIGPCEVLEPGSSAAFAEEWELLPYLFPEEGSTVDLKEILRLAADRK